MRLLIHSVARGPIGGVETYLRGLVPALAARGHEIALVMEHRYESAAAHPDPYAVCAAEWCVEEMGVAAALRAAAAWRPELIWTHSPHNLELEDGLLRLAPAVLFAHNFNGTCATGAKYQRWPRAHVCTRRLGGGCVWVNATRNCGILNPLAFAREWTRQVQHRGRLPGYRRILVASQWMMAELQRHGVSAVQCERLAYPLETPWLAVLPARSGPPARILMLARLVPGKGGDVLLRASARAQARLGRRLSLTIAGAGPELERLRRMAVTLGLEADFPGWIDARERRQRLQAADLVAVPSLWPEPFGMAGIEGFACGVPGVAFAVGGIPDWLRPGINGELAPASPLTAEPLAQALCRALGDDQHWQRLRRGAWESAAEYGMDPHLDRLEDILQASMAEGVGLHG